MVLARIAHHLPFARGPIRIRHRDLIEVGQQRIDQIIVQAPAGLPQGCEV